MRILDEDYPTLSFQGEEKTVISQQPLNHNKNIAIEMPIYRSGLMRYSDKRLNFARNAIS